jgi:hypothetical protein
MSFPSLLSEGVGRMLAALAKQPRELTALRLYCAGDS